MKTSNCEKAIHVRAKAIDAARLAAKKQQPGGNNLSHPDLKGSDLAAFRAVGAVEGGSAILPGS
jgi:hypothetical protein